MLVAFLLAASPLAAQTYDLSWYTVDGGGATFLSGGPYTLGATAGQPDAGPHMTGGTYGLDGGFWEGGVPDADVSLTKTDSPDPIVGLQTLTYTITVTNAGPDPASTVSVVDTLPPGVLFVSAGGPGWTCGELAGIVTCTRTALPVGAIRTITLQVTAPAGAGLLTNSATVTAAERDPNEANNTASAQTTVNPAPAADLAISKTDGGVTARWKKPLTYTIIVTNNGPSTVTGAHVTDNVPGILNGVTWACLASLGSSCTASGSGNINDSSVNLPVGGTVTYTVVGTVPYGTVGLIPNTAAAAVPGGMVDPVGPNNASSTSTPVTDLIFADGFESGLGAWSSSQTDSGDLSIVAPGMASTAHRLQAVINDVNGLFVQDDSPDNEDRYRARFYLDPTGFDPGEASGNFRTRVFIGFEESPTRRVFAIVLKRQGNAYSILGRARRDDNSQANTAFYPISAAPHAIEVDWIRATSADANDGVFRLFIDGVLEEELTNVDSSISQIDFARLGALSVKPGASGQLHWDEFESRHENYIGPLP
jgi:uncharacterized repeat protein (TIGR01451 family)